MRVKFNILPTKTLLEARGLEPKGKVQKFVDNEVLRLADPYVPSDTTTLRKSGTQSTNIGSGEVRYRTPYARKQYHENKGNGLRGKMWFERMKADNKETILKGAREIAGGK